MGEGTDFLRKIIENYNYLNRGHELIQPEVLSGKQEKDIRTEYIKWCDVQLNEFQQLGKRMKDIIVEKTKITNEWCGWTD